MKAVRFISFAPLLLMTCAAVAQPDKEMVVSWCFQDAETANSVKLEEFRILPIAKDYVVAGTQNLRDRTVHPVGDEEVASVSGGVLIPQGWKSFLVRSALMVPAGADETIMADTVRKAYFEVYWSPSTKSAHLLVFQGVSDEMVERNVAVLFSSPVPVSKAYLGCFWLGEPVRPK
jgi:hypothetical protein